MYQKVDSKWLVVDETSPFYFTLVNDYYVLFAGIRVKFYSDFSNIVGLDEHTEYEFFPKSGITLETSLTCKYRGEYEVGIKTVVIEDYFRLFSLSYKNREPLKVIVRPKLVHLESLCDVDIKNAVNESAYGTSEPDVLVRKYESGDDLRWLHSPVSAKTSELFVRLRTGLEYEGVGVVLNTKRVGREMRDYLPVENKMLETALALTLLMAKENIPVLHLHEDASLVVKNVSRIEAFNEYYDFVAGINFNDSLDAKTLYVDAASHEMLLKSKQVFLIISEYSDALYEFAGLLGEHGVPLVIYYVGEEIPREIAAISMSHVQLKLIKPHDDLTEVM